MIKQPKITIRQAPNFPDNVEVNLLWEGEYKTMLTFHKSDFVDNDGERAKTIIAAHTQMVKKEIQERELLELFKRWDARMKYEKLKWITELEKLKS